VNLPFTKFSTNERKELLARSLRSKSDRIDVFSVDLIWVPRFARWAETLDTFLARELSTEVISYALKACYYDNKLVASPLYIDVGLMYYRKDLVNQLPHAEEIIQKLKNSITWEEFLELSHQMPYNSQGYYLFPANNYEGLICSFVELLWEENKLMIEGDSVNLNTPVARRALQFLVDLVHRYRITPPIVTGFDEYKSYLYALQNDVPFLRGWPGFKKHYRNIITDSTKLDLYDVAALPHFANRKAVNVFGGWNLMISRSSAHKKEALEFLKFVLRKDNQEILYEYGGYIPVAKAVYRDSVFLKKNPQLQYYRKLLDRGFHRPYMQDYTKISDVISYYLHLAIKGDMPVRQALFLATKTINEKKVLIK